MPVPVDSIIGFYTQTGHKQGEWDMFERITTAYFEKEYYFLNEKTGKVYSRLSHEELPTREDAYNEFVKELLEDR